MQARLQREREVVEPAQSADTSDTQESYAPPPEDFVEAVACQLCRLDGHDPDDRYAVAGYLGAPNFIRVADRAALPATDQSLTPAWRLFETSARVAIRAFWNLGVKHRPPISSMKRTELVNELARIIASHRGGKKWNGIVMQTDLGVAMKLARLAGPLHPMPTIHEEQGD